MKKRGNAGTLFTFEAIGVARPMNTQAWRWYGSYYRGSFGRLTACVLLSVAQSALALPLAYLVKYAFDRGVPSSSMPLLASIGAAILVVYIADAAASLLTRHLSLTTTKGAIAAIRLDLIDGLYRLPASFYSGADTGSVHATIVQDSERLDIMSNALLAQLLPAVTIGASLTVWLAILNWRLLVAALTVFPLVVLVNRFLGPKVRSRTATFRSQFEAFSHGVLHVLRTITLTRIHTAESFERARQATAIDRLRESSGRMGWLISAYSLIQSTVATIAGVLILVVGGTAVAHGTMTLGALMSFYVGVGLLAPQVSNALTAVPYIIAGRESLLALYRLQSNEETLPYHGTRTIDFRGAIDVDDVAFSYGGQPVLSDVSLSIRPGWTTAIVGPNGAGKTSLVNLILGFYRPTLGRVCADRQPFDELDLEHLRRSIGVVTQDPIMMAGTIWENITYGQPDATTEAVTRAAMMATADAFIRSQPQGYHTPIGELGVRLSGGQRQRIAIARALLRVPALLILDEPTNHLDEAAVHALLINLKTLPQRPAILVITHDAALARQADQQYALDAGGRVLATTP